MAARHCPPVGLSQKGNRVKGNRVRSVLLTYGMWLEQFRGMARPLRIVVAGAWIRRRSRRPDGSVDRLSVRDIGILKTGVPSGGHGAQAANRRFWQSSSRVERMRISRFGLIERSFINRFTATSPNIAHSAHETTASPSPDNLQGVAWSVIRAVAKPRRDRGRAGSGRAGERSRKPRPRCLRPCLQPGAVLLG